jgi:hypothetical protein
LNPPLEQNDTWDWIASNAPDADVILKHSTMDETQVRDLFAENMETGSIGAWLRRLFLLKLT